MKKIIGIAMVVFLLFAISVEAVDFGEADYKVVYSPKEKTLSIEGKYVTLKINAETGTVRKLIPETWKVIGFNSNYTFLSSTTGSITALSFSSNYKPESYKTKTDEVGPFLITYETPEKVLIVQGTILKYFFLRVHNCGQVEKMEWKEINKNER